MKSLRALLGLALLLPTGPVLAQQVTVASTTPGVVWTYSANGCGAGLAGLPSTDYSDVPARPFLVGPAGSSTVLWFASNSSGNWAGVGVGSSPDILANLQRGTARGAGCLNWLPPASYPGSTPNSYNSGLWMVAPFTPDGINIQALVHNEFHGELAGPGNTWCSLPPGQPPSPIYLPCNYWNIVSASSADGGNSSFQLLQATPGSNVPAIAINQQYQQGPAAPLLPQGMTAQSNIVQQGGFYYVLVQQLPRPSPTSPATVCLFRAAVPAQPGAPLTWWGWVSPVFGLGVPRGYPPAKGPLSGGCEPVLGSPFRFSWSFNTVLNQLIIIGQDVNSPGKYPNCPYAPGASAATSDAAFVYMTATLSPMMSGIFNFPLIIGKTETCLLQTNSIGNWAGNPSFPGQAYPSLLDPTSPQLMPGDRNFQYSGARPFLYYTRLNATSTGRPSNDRDLVRVQLNVSP